MKIYADLTDDDIQDIYKQIAKNIKRIRKLKQITQSDISLSMGFTTATFYTNAESSKQNKHFNLEHIIKIANILDVDIKEFFKDIKEQKYSEDKTTL